MSVVCTFGFYDPEGARFWVLEKGLHENSIQTVACRTEKKGALPKFLDLWRKSRSLSFDAILVAFPGHYLVPLAWLIAKKRRVPLLLDAFISLYDTEVNDRCRVKEGSLKAWWLKTVDRMSCRLADRVLIDTNEDADYFSATFGIPREKFIVVPIGCRTDLFRSSSVPPLDHGPLLVEFHGTFIPLQGIDTIIAAMKLLQDRHEPIILQILGGGQTGREVRAQAEALGLQNVTFAGHKPMTEVATALTSSHVGLGIFGTTDKATRVIPHKAYEVLAGGRALITGDTPAARRVLGDDAVLVKPGDPAALADALVRLRQNPDLLQKLGEKGARRTLEEWLPAPIVRPVAEVLRQLWQHAKSSSRA